MAKAEEVKGTGKEVEFIPVIDPVIDDKTAEEVEIVEIINTIEERTAEKVIIEEIETVASITALNPFVDVVNTVNVEHIEV